MKEAPIKSEQTKHHAVHAKINIHTSYADRLGTRKGDTPMTTAQEANHQAKPVIASLPYNPVVKHLPITQVHSYRADRSMVPLHCNIQQDPPKQSCIASSKWVVLNKT